jgi:hypothetical protein
VWASSADPKQQSEVSKREKWLVPIFTNFLNITNLDLIIFTQNTFIVVKTGYVKKLLLTPLPPPQGNKSDL